MWRVDPSTGQLSIVVRGAPQSATNPHLTTHRTASSVATDRMLKLEVTSAYLARAMAGESNFYFSNIWRFLPGHDAEQLVPRLVNYHLKYIKIHICIYICIYIYNVRQSYACVCYVCTVLRGEQQYKTVLINL